MLRQLEWYLMMTSLYYLLVFYGWSLIALYLHDPVEVIVFLQIPANYVYYVICFCVANFLYAGFTFFHFALWHDRL